MDGPLHNGRFGSGCSGESAMSLCCLSIIFVLAHHGVILQQIGHGRSLLVLNDHVLTLRHVLCRRSTKSCLRINNRQTSLHRDLCGIGEPQYASIAIWANYSRIL